METDTIDDEIENLEQVIKILTEKVKQIIQIEIL